MRVLQICITDVYQALRHGTQKNTDGGGIARFAKPHHFLTR
ncbi:Hypothetical protein SMB2099_2306 [Serratia marcescens SMB2099]|nr:Hypothetical protein SMB2099_2306 [Serratia marcescens SMB2099]